MMLNSNEEGKMFQEDPRSSHSLTSYWTIWFFNWDCSTEHQGVMIIHTSRFGTIWVIRLGPTKDKVGDFKINISHSDFQTQV